MTKIPTNPTRDWFEELERRRLDSPKRVLRLIEKAIHKTEPPLLPLLYSVYGGTLRQLARLSDARWAYFFGLQLAERFDSLSDVASISQKLTWLHVADGDLHSASLRAREALALHAMLDDRHGIGRMLVDQGILFSLQNEFSKAKLCIKAALRHLPFSDKQYMFAAHHELAITSWENGERLSAFRHIEEARKFIPDRTAKSKLLWFEALVVKQEEDADTSTIFEEILDFCLEVGDLLDAVLAAAELIQSYVKAGKLEPAITIGSSIGEIAFKLDSRLAATAALDIHRSCLKGSIELDLVQSSIIKISKVAGRHLKSRPATNDIDQMAPPGT